MDTKFFQFWQDFINRAASGRMDPNAFTGWFRQGNDAPDMPDELMSMFKKYYAPAQMAADAPDYSAFLESARKEFNQSLKDFYSMLDVVPKQAYLDLEKKNHVLEKKVADLQAVITQLKLLFKTSPPNAEEGIGALNQMLKTQNEHFLKMMDSLAGFYGITKDAQDTEPE